MDYKEEDKEDKKYKKGYAKNSNGNGKPPFGRKEFKKDVTEAVVEAKKPKEQKKKVGRPTPHGVPLSYARSSRRRGRRSLSSPGFPTGAYRDLRRP